MDANARGVIWRTDEFNASGFEDCLDLLNYRCGRIGGGVVYSSFYLPTETIG